MDQPVEPCLPNVWGLMGESCLSTGFGDTTSLLIALLAKYASASLVFHLTLVYRFRLEDHGWPAEISTEIMVGLQRSGWRIMVALL